MYLAFGMSQQFFVHNSGIVFFVFLVVALWTSLHGLKGPAEPCGDGARPTARPRVLHFVTGGFSGATQVAVDLVSAHRASGRFDARLVLRRKRNTSDERVQKLRDGGIDVDVVAGWSHAATVWQLRRICLDFRPDIVVAHGFSDHLWGRFAALWAGVPCLVHVEHNSRERYTRWRLAQALWLTERTAAIVGCSEGVRQSLQDRGFPAAKLLAISNGHPARALSAGAATLAAAPPGHRHGRALCAAKGTMPPCCARWWCCDSAGLTPTLTLAGGGKARAQQAAQRLSAELGLQDQVQFIGMLQRRARPAACAPRLRAVHALRGHAPFPCWKAWRRAAWWWAAAWWACRKWCGPATTACWPRMPTHESLADALQQALQDDEAALRMAATARQEALSHYSLQRMTGQYEDLFARLLQGERP